MPTVFCGIDIGTQGARCILVRDDGEPVGRAECAFELRSMPLPDGWFEQEPGAWMAAIRAALAGALKELDSRAPSAHRLAAISVTGTSGTLCVLDSQGRPLAPAIMYNDSRSAQEAGLVQDAGADLAARLGYRFNASFALPKVLWLKRRRPQVYAQARFLASPTDYVIGWLTGNWHRSDQTNALKSGYDLISSRWPDFIERKLGIPLAMLPPVQRPGVLAGKLTRQRAGELGLPVGTPVAAGMTDGCASQVASGAAGLGQYNTTLGTTMVVKGVSDRLLIDPLGRIYCHRHPEGWWLPGGASNTGAECLEVEFGPQETQALSDLALRSSPTGLVAYPLVGKGERFPFMNPQAERFLVGTPGSREELFAAYLEGVACLERLAYETLEELGARVGDAVYSAGGGSRSGAWLQIRADMLNRAIRRPAEAGAAMGAAIVAASMERFSNLTEAARAMVRIEREVQPRPDRTSAYADKYGQFRNECAARGYLPGP
jgi:xylulokinase